ncbi:YrhC family protein [Halalkalibacterium ligniniphilum]|uniref:YrhC family protein n=1 Tax=Halalkalibacterium ligniniphilum TaxID=1134413 RepID=UPI0003452DE2|nr:YrhC family protein [Halalkalibacterium ligniniphilum]
MDEQKIQELEGKVADYKRFGFILLSLSVFLFIGAIIPSDYARFEMPELFIVAVFVSLGLSLLFHQKALAYQKKLLEQE